MCGIAGIFMGGTRDGDAAAERSAVERMCSRLVHRGPDAGGVWCDDRGRCTLGHRRLSIIDLSSAGAQPMASDSSPWVLSFNGEIYNFPALRRELETCGAVFRGHSDTEVLLAALGEWGVEALPRLDGMFAFAAFNRVSGELLLARDPFGEKPLYYCDAGSSGIAFASELTALEALPWFRREVSVDRIAEMLMFQYIGSPRTIYPAASKLPPGHYMVVHASGRREIRRYFRYDPTAVADHSLPLWEAADALEDLLTESLERRLVADVPLGALLSGGVDSATACGLIRRKLGVPLKTFSLGFQGAAESETPVAAAFARAIGSEHHELIVDAQAVDFLADVGRLQDEPNGDVSCFPTYLLSQLVREHVTVAISGDGGDELFGGYGRYLYTCDDLADRPLSPFGAEYYSGRILVMSELEIRALLGDVPKPLRQHLQMLRAGLDEHRGDPLGAMRATDAANYMPGAVLAKVDRMSMQHSLEVRTPFLNRDVAAFAERMPDPLLVAGGYGKLVLREVASRFLPRDLIELPKKGFGLPSQDWAAPELRSLAIERLTGRGSVLARTVGLERMRQFFHRPQRLEPLWAMCTLESWLREHDAEVVDAPSIGLPLRPRPRSVERQARWLTADTLLVTDPDFAEPAAGPEGDGRSTLGRGVTERTMRCFEALRPLLEGEGDPPDDTSVVLRAAPDLGQSLVEAGIDVRGKRVVWFRADALVRHGTPRVSVGRSMDGSFSVSVGLSNWRRSGLRLRSTVSVAGPAEALLVFNPFDDSTPLPIIEHSRPLSRERVRRRHSDARGGNHALTPAQGAALEVRNAPDTRADDGPSIERALVVTHALPSGGAERQWCYLAAGLTAAGIDTRLLLTHEARGHDAHYVALAERLGVEIHQLPDAGVEAIVGGIRARDLTAPIAALDQSVADLVTRCSIAFRASTPDVVFSQLDQTNLVASLAGLRSGVPRVVVSFRNYSPRHFDYVFQEWFRDAYRSVLASPRVAATGNSLAGNADYAAWLDIDPGMLTEIPNALDEEPAETDAGSRAIDLRRRLQIRDDAPVVVGAFRLSAEKRPYLFLEACARLHAVCPDVRVLLAGVGPLQEQVALQVQRQGLGEVVTLLGARRDIDTVFGAGDVLLLTSEFEGMPNVVVEALAAGIPVVATPAGAVPEIIEDGVTGRVVEASADALAVALGDVLSDLPQWKARVAAEMPGLRRRYAPQGMVAAYLEVASDLPRV